MGDKSLMKKVSYILVATTLALNANYSVKQIENMVLKIHNKRAGLESSVLDNTFEPFVSKKILTEEKGEVKVPVKVNRTEDKMELHAILGDKAFINNKWLKVNDKIYGYVLKYIGKRGVVLQNGNSIKKLLFHEENNNLIKLEGR
jgi:hypothetical protein